MHERLLSALHLHGCTVQVKRIDLKPNKTKTKAIIIGENQIKTQGGEGAPILILKIEPPPTQPTIL